MANVSSMTVKSLIKKLQSFPKDLKVELLADFPKAKIPVSHFYDDDIHFYEVGCVVLHEMRSGPPIVHINLGNTVQY